MLSASTNFKNYIQQYGKEIALRISWDAIVITSEDVLSCDKWFDGAFYKSVMQGLELEIEGVYDMTGKALLVEFGVSLNGSAIEWLTWGTFYVKSFSTIAASKSTKIEAYDAMLKSHIPYDLSPTYPITVGNYLQAICTRLGITLATPTFTNSSVSIPNEKYAMLDNILFRDVLTDLSEVSGGIIHIRADGQLAVKYPTATSETLNSNVKSLDVDKLFGEVNTLVLATTPAEDNTLREDLVSVASYGRHEVRFEDNQIMVLDPDSFIDNLFNTIKYTKYYPFDLDSFGYGYFEVGDIITVVDEDSVSYQTIVLGGEIKINAGFSEMMYARVPEMATTPDYDNAQRTISPRETIIRLDRQEKKILLRAEEIALLTGDVANLDDIVNGNQANGAGLVLTPTDITSTVRSSTAYTTDLAGKENNVFKQSTAPSHVAGRLWLDTSVTPNILYRSTGSAWVKATPTQASEVGAYSSGQVDTLLTNYSTITQTSDQIALEVGTAIGGQDSIIPYTQSTWERGGILTSSGLNISLTNRLRMINHSVVISSTDYIFTKSSGIVVAYYWYQSDGTFISSFSWLTSSEIKITSPSNAGRLRIAIRKPDDSTFLLSEMPNHWVRVVPVGKYLKGSKFTLDNDGAEFYGDGFKLYDNSSNLKVFFDLVKDAFNLSINANMPIYEPSGITELVQIMSGGTKGLQFGEPDSVSGWYKAYITAVNMKTISGLSEDEIRLRIRSGENLELYGDDLLSLNSDGVISVNRGIKFPSDQVASTNANTLDDYEEGTFTPEVVGITTAGAGTYTTQLGKYTKVGNKVSFVIKVVLTAHTGTGGMRINNLPFTCANDGMETPCTITSLNLTYSGQLACWVVPNTTNLDLRSMSTGGAGGVVAMDGTCTLYIAGTYMV